jgi:type 1 fimbria pilin
MRSNASFVMSSLLLWLVLLVAASDAFAMRAPDQGHGKVSMQGSIIDTPCAIAIGSRDQAIELITLPLDQIIRDGAGPAKPFSIHLENCVLQPLTPGRQPWSNFRVTFDGAATDGELFSLRGGVRGIGLEISDAQGNRILPGTTAQTGQLQPGAMRLDYSLRLVGNHQKLRAGAYSTTVRFKLDYF